MVPLSQSCWEIKWVKKYKAFWGTRQNFDIYLQAKKNIHISWVSRDLPSLVNLQSFLFLLF